ncbi:MAG: thioredoxin fold domain-containing protein [Desulfobacteraceae bacterium]
MGAVTYPNEKVIHFLDYNFVPVQIPTANTEMVSKFSVTWTPTLIVMDAEGKEKQRVVGFLPPEEFIPTFMAAKGRWHFDAEQYSQANALFEEVLASYPESQAAPEALYFKGVSQYKTTHDPKPLREAYDALTAKYPQSEWTKKALPYRLIEK